MRSTNEMHEYIEKKGVGEVRDKTNKVETGKSAPVVDTIIGRLIHKVQREIVDLLVTTDSLEDKTIIEAPKYFSNWTILMIGILKRVLFTSLFFIFAVQTYQLTTEKQQFIGASLDSGDCSIITRTWEGVFTADRNGRWRNDKNYIANLAMYKFDFHALSITDEEYRNMMNTFGYQLADLGVQTTQNDLASNMLIWSSWKYYYDYDDHFQLITMTGSPQMILKNFEGQRGTTKDSQAQPRTATSGKGRPDCVHPPR